MHAKHSSGTIHEPVSSILGTENIRKLGYMQSRPIFIQRRKTVYNSKYVNNLQLKSFQTIVEDYIIKVKKLQPSD